jgi:hypothetical protein
MRITARSNQQSAVSIQHSAKEYHRKFPLMGTGQREKAANFANDTNLGNISRRATGSSWQ